MKEGWYINSKGIKAHYVKKGYYTCNKAIGKYKWTNEDPLRLIRHKLYTFDMRRIQFCKNCLKILEKGIVPTKERSQRKP